jgi:hypothetical protein
MAEVACTKSQPTELHLRGCTMFTWGAFTATDLTAAAVKMGGLTDKSVQIQGTFDSCTVTLQGSNDGTNYHLLTDPQGTDISKTASDLEAVTEATLWVKPVLASAGANTSVVVTIFAKGIIV